jgi:hypothetical protein
MQWRHSAIRFPALVTCKCRSSDTDLGFPKGYAFACQSPRKTPSAIGEKVFRSKGKPFRRSTSTAFTNPRFTCLQHSPCTTFGMTFGEGAVGAPCPSGHPQIIQLFLTSLSSLAGSSVGEGGPSALGQVGSWDQQVRTAREDWRGGGVTFRERHQLQGPGQS